MPIAKYLFFDEKSNEFITSIVVEDEETFNEIWRLIDEADLKKLDGSDPDYEIIERFKSHKRIPNIIKSEKTEHIFKLLEIETTRFTGILRGWSSIPMPKGG